MENRSVVTPEWTTHDQAVARIKSEILRDIRNGVVPITCRTFSGLHDYVDANGYGGAFEHEFDNEHTDFWNAVTDEVNKWMERGWFNEHPIEYPEWLTGFGFDDYSYHNDLCARAELPLNNGAEFPRMVLWVDHADAEEREYDDFPQFLCFVAANQDEYDENDGAAKVYSGEIGEECRAAIAAYLKARAHDCLGCEQLCPVEDNYCASCASDQDA